MAETGGDGADDDNNLRFFTADQKKRTSVISLRSIEASGSHHGEGSNDEVPQGRCLTLRFIQKIFSPCSKKKTGLWESSQGDVFKAHEVEETRYPIMLKFLESKIHDVIFVASCLASVYLFFFSVGFLMKSRVLWGIIHIVNAIYTLCLFGQWLQILIKSKYAKTNQGYTRWDVIIALLSIFPSDLIVLVIYTLNKKEVETSTDHIIVTASRLNYLLRIYYVSKYFAIWENQLIVGDFKMLMIRVALYYTFLTHIFGCVWHRIACSSFSLKHFKMKPEEATTDICTENSWIMIVLKHSKKPLLDHPEFQNVLWTHYLVCLYWAVGTGGGLGYGDFKIYLTSNAEVVFTAFTQIFAWIFTLANVSGSLTSLLVESDTEREIYLTRRFAIKSYLDFTYVGKSISNDVKAFYDYLWQRRKGIMKLDLVDNMPPSMKAEVFYDVNKFVLDQLPLLANMDEAFIMNLSVHMKHDFHLQGEILYRRNDTGNAMYFVLKGFLEILSEDETHPIANIRSGSVIGEICLMHPYPHVATVRCGSESDILVLTKQNFKHQMKLYPEHLETFRRRIEQRFEQSELLLALCDKHNQYPAAFAKINEHLRHSSDFAGRDLAANPPAVIQNVTQLQPVEDGDPGTKAYRNIEDLDGMSISPQNLKKMSMAFTNSEREKTNAILRKRRKTLEEEAYAALESDVTRAGSLAKDLGIPRPPLLVSAPGGRTRKANQNEQEETKEANIILRVMPLLKGQNRASLVFAIKVLISILSVITVMYYMYAWAFRSRTTIIMNYAFHITDVIFALDYYFDMLQVVVTPQRTLETVKEIISYRARKQPSFYLRAVAILPWEYLIAPMASCTFYGWFPEKYFCFNLLKLNRCLQLIVVVNLFREIGAMAGISVLYMSILKFTTALLFCVHTFAVFYKLIRNDWLHIDLKNDTYEAPLYWSSQITTSTGFGDMVYLRDAEVAVLTIALLAGTVVLTYFKAKNAALLANSERRRVGFQQTYYGLQTFMKLRKFPKTLAFRVTQYYDLQWQAHQGVLIPTEKSVIWDAPESVIDRVTMAQAKKFIVRVPLAQYASETTQHQYSRALKQYFVPPEETILYPKDKRRELYIIVKGGCKVLTPSGRKIGILGEGNYFGLVGLIKGINKDFQVVTETHCQFFCLLFDDYMDICRVNHAVLRDYRVLRGELPSKHSQGPNDMALKVEINIAHSNFMTELEDLQRKRKHDAEAAGPMPDLIKPSKMTVVAIPKDVEKGETAPGPIQKPACSKFFRIFTYILLEKAIHPDGRFYRIWTIVRVIMSVLVTIFVTSQAFFAFQPGRCLLIMIGFDLFAWFDLFIMFNLGFYKGRNEFVSDPIERVRHYLIPRGLATFALDLAACFPFDYFFLSTISSELSVISPMTEFGTNPWFERIAYMRLPRVLQFYKMLIAGHRIDQVIFKSLTFITLLEVVPLMFIFLHLMTCVSFALTCHWPVAFSQNPIYCEPESFMRNFKPLAERPSSDPNYALLVKPYQGQGFTIDTLSNSPFKMYILGLYWVTQTALHVGFGDFVLYDEARLDLYTEQNRILAVFVILLGCIVSLYLGSKLTACMVGEDSRRIAIREQMKVVFNFLAQYKVPRPIQRRVREAYFNAWDKTKGISPSGLFVALHPALKADVTKQLYEASLRKSPLLTDLDEAGIRLLSSRLKEVFYPEGEYVMHHGDLNDDVFVISTGIIVAYSVSGQILSYMAPGTLFGEISAMFQIQRIYSAVAATDADIFVFSRVHFIEFLSLYPAFRKTLEETSLIHYQEILISTAGIDGSIPGMEGLDPTISQESLGRRKDLKRRVAEANQRTDFLPEAEEPKPNPGLDKFSSTMEFQSAAASPPDVSLKTSYVNITAVEAKKHPTCILDPLRVTLKTVTTGAKDGGTKDNVALDDNTFKNNKWWSILLSFGRIPRDEMGLIHIYQEKNKCNILNFVVSPLSIICSSPFLACVYLMLTCLSCSLASFEMAFASGVETAQERKILFGTTIAVEVFFLVRLIGNFHLAFFDDDGNLITGNKAIVLRYIKRYDGLFLDLLTFPFYFFVYIYDPKSILAAHLKGIQLFRMLLFVRYLNETESELRMKASMVKILKISIVLCFIFHFCACAWYLVSCNGFKCEEGSWMNRSVQTMMLQTPKLVKDPKDVSIGSRYFLSIFYVTTAITFTGLNYIEPARLEELGLTTFFIFATVFIIGFLVGEISQVLASQMASKIHYQHELTVLQEHFVSLGLNGNKVSEVQRYYKLMWTQCKGMSYYDLLQGLPYPLRADITFAIYGANIKSSRILSKLDDIIIRQISARMRHEIYLPGTHIIRTGDVCDSMYFIKRGEVVILDENQNLELCVEILYENECFGEVKVLLPREQYRFSYIARLETEVGILHREDIDSVMSNYPTGQADVIARAKKIKNHRMLMKEEEDRIHRQELGIVDPDKPTERKGGSTSKDKKAASSGSSGGRRRKMSASSGPASSSSSVGLAGSAGAQSSEGSGAFIIKSSDSIPPQGSRSVEGSVAAGSVGTGGGSRSVQSASSLNKSEYGSVNSTSTLDKKGA